MNEKIELKVQGITYNPIQSNAYALLLREVDGQHRIPVVVGMAEAQSIAMRIEGIIPPRPMTHDLMVSIMHAFGISLDEVFIYRFNEGVFMSELKLNDGQRQITLDSRTSDAIALALRTGARIFTTPEIVDRTGIVVHDKAGKRPHHYDRLEDMPTALLEKRMQEYVAKEEYEHAAEIQRILRMRKQTNVKEKQ